MQWLRSQSLRNLVDLDGFEPSTSSMPFKKYQSLTDVLRQNKGLSGMQFGRHWTPEAQFFVFGLRADSKFLPASIEKAPQDWRM